MPWAAPLTVSRASSSLSLASALPCWAFPSASVSLSSVTLPRPSLAWPPSLSFAFSNFSSALIANLLDRVSAQVLCATASLGRQCTGAPTCRSGRSALRRRGDGGQRPGELCEQVQVWAGGPLPSVGVSGEGGADDLDAELRCGEGRLHVVAVGHQRAVELVAHSRDGLGEGAAVGARAQGAVQGEDVRARLDHSTAVIEGGRDEHTVDAVLPDPDHRDVHRRLHGADVLEPLGAHRRGTAGPHGLCDLGHGARIAHRLSGVGLAGDDQAAFEAGDQWVHRGVPSAGAALPVSASRRWTCRAMYAVSLLLNGCPHDSSSWAEIARARSIDSGSPSSSASRSSCGASTTSRPSASRVNR